MGKVVLIVGKSGSGKSRSVKELNPETTLFIDIADKGLPFKSSYEKLSPDGKTGNHIVTSNPEKIVYAIEKIPPIRKELKEIIIDDFQYFMSFLYINRMDERQYYNKFNDILKYTKLINDAAKKTRDDIITYLLCHSEDLGEFDKKAKTAGKAVDKYLTLEGLFTIVLWTKVEYEPGDPPKRGYYFETQSDGSNTAKSPEEMLDFKIENDLSLVSKAIRDYYNL